VSHYQALLVEDNAVYRQAIRTLIDWERSGFCIGAEAVNGKQALEKIAVQRFDLILTDVSMPEMNGVDLVKAVKERGEDAVIVMLSAYDDFQFVKDSLKLGAEDYLLKQELAPESLTAMLAQVADKLNRLQVQKSKELEDRTEMRAARLKQLLSGEAPADAGADADLATMLPPGEYRLVLLAARHGETVCREDWRLDAPNEGGARVDGDVALAIPIRTDRLAVVIAVPEGAAGRSGSDRAIGEAAVRWLGRGDTRGRRAAAIAAGRGSGGLISLRDAYKEAERALFQAVYDGWGRLYEAADTRTPPPVDPACEAEAMQRWQAALRSASGDELAAAAASHFKLFARQKPAKPILQRHLVELYASLYHHSEPAMGEPRDWWTALTESLERLDPLDRMEEALAAACRERFPGSEAVPANRKEIRQAIAYIRAHYAEEISVADLSAHLGFSANYLSNLFRSETGLRVTEFVNRVRMEVAKRLLRDSQLKVYEVAGKVGYHDASYFCKVFKEITGETVTAFRQKD